ncbi:TolC family protein [Geobacter pickeringii]|uniref:RND transporter n=1 Tax=Geobacter pickeringii TaxID=345632 RepID=A0A0B5BFW8_9BACT|nr:TolC family protein [Geobacter pickeringii]AJE03415.1 RND transporter [Geobacter pickeringii]
MNRSRRLIMLLALLVPVSAKAESTSLEECLRLALSANYALAVTGHDRQIAEEGVVRAKSGYLPRLDLQGGYTVQAKPQAVQIQNFSAETQDANFGFLSVSATQTIYDFGRTASRARRASLLQEATSRDYEAREKEVYLQVVEAYYGILEARKLLAAAEEEVVQRTDHLRIAKNLYEQGVVTRNDLLQAEVKLADSRQQRLGAANRVENRWLTLDYLTGRPLSFRADLSEASTAAQLPAPEDAERRAVANRPELAALARSVEAGEAEVVEARSAFYPELYVKAGIDYVENSKVREQTIYSATAGVKINLFDGFASTARRREAVESMMKQRDSLRQLREQIRVELRTALNDARVAADRIATVEQAIRQGEENLRINRDRYQEQVGTATDVLDAQTLLTQIKTDFYRAIYDSQVATARVRKAMGEL